MVKLSAQKHDESLHLTGRKSVGSLFLQFSLCLFRKTWEVLGWKFLLFEHCNCNEIVRKGNRLQILSLLRLLLLGHDVTEITRGNSFWGKVVDWFCCKFTWREYYTEYYLLLKIFDYLIGDFYYIFPSYFYSVLIHLCQHYPYIETWTGKSNKQVWGTRNECDLSSWRCWKGGAISGGGCHWTC